MKIQSTPSGVFERGADIFYAICEDLVELDFRDLLEVQRLTSQKRKEMEDAIE